MTSDIFHDPRKIAFLLQFCMIFENFHAMLKYVCITYISSNYLKFIYSIYTTWLMIISIDYVSLHDIKFCRTSENLRDVTKVCIKYVILHYL
jgi:hypothetical protein